MQQKKTEHVGFYYNLSRVQDSIDFLALRFKRVAKTKLISDDIIVTETSRLSKKNLFRVFVGFFFEKIDFLQSAFVVGVNL